MKILIDARLYGLENAGLGRYIINLLDELKKLDKKNKYAVLLREKYFNRLKSPQNFKKVLAEFRHYSVKEQVFLPKIIEKEKPDLVHFPHFNAPILYNGRFVVTIHDLLMHNQKGIKATTLALPVYAVKRFGYRVVFDNAVKKSLKIIVPSNFVKKELTKFYKISPKKVKVTYEGVDKQFLEGGGDGEVLKKYGLSYPYFIYAGNAYPHKNLDRAIEAIILLNKKGTRVMPFVIVSARGVFVKRLEESVERTKAQKYVKILGFIPDQDLISLYKNSLAFFYPSLSEGFGLPGLEAMAAGTLVLASEIPVFKEIYKDTPIYFDPYDVNSIKIVLEKVVKMGPDERNAMIEKGRKLVKTYSWSKMAEQTLEIYESCAYLRSGK